VRIRSLTKTALACALLACTTSIFLFQALENIFSYAWVNSEHYAFTNIQEKPTAVSSPISSRPILLLQLGRPSAGDALWFSNFALKFTSAFHSLSQAESKPPIITAPRYIKEPISSHTFSKTLGNPCSCSV